ncbi:MAG: nucleotidyltransferase domain-containing protein [Candidatus Caldarchaeum sp.]
MATIAKCARLSTTERITLQRFTAEAQAVLGGNLVSIILFGSRGRGEAHSDSDVDLLLVVKDLKKASKALDSLVLDRLLDHNLLLAVIPVEELEFARQERLLYRLASREGAR